MNVVEEEAFITEYSCRLVGGSLAEKSSEDDGEDNLRKEKEAALVVAVVSRWSDGREQKEVPSPADIAIAPVSFGGVWSVEEMVERNGGSGGDRRRRESWDLKI